jgi:hypothetical protein
VKQPSLTFDKDAPSKLRKTQEWFASILTSPIDEDSRMSPLSPSGDCIEEESFDYIIPSPSLRPAQRIQLYHQQYWWRLLDVLHDTAPLVARLFGYHDFNQIIGKPYLKKYPPDTWSLNCIGNLIPQWIEEEYHANDKQLVLDSAKLDIGLNIAFFAKHHKAIDAQAAGGMNNILSQKMRLQPHVFLFDVPYDLLKFRKEMLKEEVEHWMNHDFPKLLRDQRHTFVLYRNIHNNLNCEEISSSAYRLLSLFSEGTTINDALEWLEQQDETLNTEAANNLHLWFQEWIFRQWLYVVEDDNSCTNIK